MGIPTDLPFSVNLPTVQFDEYLKSKRQYRHADELFRHYAFLLRWWGGVSQMYANNADNEAIKVTDMKTKAEILWREVVLLRPKIDAEYAKAWPASPKFAVLDGFFEQASLRLGPLPPTYTGLLALIDGHAGTLAHSRAEREKAAKAKRDAVIKYFIGPDIRTLIAVAGAIFGAVGVGYGCLKANEADKTETERVNTSTSAPAVLPSAATAPTS